MEARNAHAVQKVLCKRYSKLWNETQHVIIGREYSKSANYVISFSQQSSRFLTLDKNFCAFVFWTACEYLVSCKQMDSFYVLTVIQFDFDSAGFA